MPVSPSTTDSIPAPRERGEARLRDVALRAGVGSTTAFRALSGTNEIASATRQKVLKAAQELGYQPNGMARALARGRSEVVALWVSEAHRPYRAHIISQFEVEARRHGYGLLIRDLQSVDDSGVDPLGGLCDGVFALGCPLQVEAALNRDEAPDRPLISLGAYYTTRTDSVGVDIFSPSLAAVRHLVGAGCETIIHLSGQWGASNHDMRLRAYTQAIIAAGMKSEIVLLPMRDNEREAGRHWARQNAAQWEPVRGKLGVFCATDDFAIGAYRGFLDAGWKIGRDVLIVGCDGIQDTQYLDVPLSTIDLPVEPFVGRAWEFFERRLGDPKIPLQHDFLTASFIARESSGTASLPASTQETLRISL